MIYVFILIAVGGLITGIVGVVHDYGFIPLIVTAPIGLIVLTVWAIKEHANIMQRVAQNVVVPMLLCQNHNLS